VEGLERKVRTFHEANGHFAVPVAADKSLHKWILYQRQREKHGKLLDERRQMLLSIDFKFQCNAKHKEQSFTARQIQEWDAMYEQLAGQTTNWLEEFFVDHGRISLRALRDRLQVRVANVNVNGDNCGRYTSLHDKSVMTDLHTTFGSYNLTNGARYQNWESLSLHVADLEPSHAAHFEALWNSLAGRDVQVVYDALLL
jgi:hypothetical protein